MGSSSSKSSQSKPATVIEPKAKAKAKPVNGVSVQSPVLDQDSIEATSEFLRKIGCVTVAAVAFFDTLPAPFAATGLLLGVVANQLHENAEARQKWSALYDELKDFQSAMSGPNGYHEILNQMIVNEEKSKETKGLVEEFREESKKMNDYLRELLQETNRFFDDEKYWSKFITANKDNDAAKKASKKLKAYRDSLRDKFDRYNDLQVVKLAQKLLNTHSEDVRHAKFRNLWSLNNWGASVSITDFVEQVRKNGSSSPELLEDFRGFLHTRDDSREGKLTVYSLNKLTESLDPLLDLEATIAALVPQKAYIGNNLELVALRELWVFGEKNKKFTSSQVPLEVFYDNLLSYSTELHVKMVSQVGKLKKLLPEQFKSGYIDVCDLASYTEDLDCDLDLKAAVEAIIEKLEDSAANAELPVPVSADAEVKQEPPIPVVEVGYTTPVKGQRSDAHAPVHAKTLADIKYEGLDGVSFVPMPNDPQRGVCVKCGKDYAFNGQGSPQKPYSPGKKMVEHPCNADGAPQNTYSPVKMAMEAEGFCSPVKTAVETTGASDKIKYAGLDSVPFVPMSTVPERGVCVKCKKEYAFNGQGSPQKPYSPGKKMLEHVC